ncbi:uncharacterized protein LOC119960685 [Scyliorhinus canicula]|uniref:uncharacterized protein LOC119960685 n=1 Tax=Scyliorhinus canicula TaxID=7830 RepID=UPI0018F441B6|nr:uncharacterized protein LOC119960685 [Scyliorhinus canicula]
MFPVSVLLWILEVGELVRDVEAGGLQKPVLTVDPPFGKFITGEKITLRCRCYCPVTRIEYYHNGAEAGYKDLKKGKCKASRDHSFAVVKGGNYTCRCQAEENGAWTNPDVSDPIQIQIGDEVSPPTISKRRHSGAKLNSDTVLISCKGDIRSKGGNFQLCRIPREQHVQTLEVRDGQKNVTFAINVADPDSLGNYMCRYQTVVLEVWKMSSFSKFVTLTDKVEQNDTSLYIGLGCAAFIIVLVIAAVIAGVIIKCRRTGRQLNESAPAKGGGSGRYQEDDGTYEDVNEHPQINVTTIYSEIV